MSIYLPPHPFPHMARKDGGPFNCPLRMREKSTDRSTFGRGGGSLGCGRSRSHGWSKEEAGSGRMSAVVLSS